MSDTQLSTLVINKLTKTQYEGITPSNQELYFVTDEDAYLAANQGSANEGKVLTVGNDGSVTPQDPVGTTDYTQLLNKPQINGNVLTGNKTASQLGFATVSTSGSYTDLSNTPNIPNTNITATVSGVSTTDTITNWIQSLASSDATLTTDVGTNTSDISTINGKIPSAASTSNQLADKAFVNSSISNMAANYVTSDVQGDNFATHAALLLGPYYNKGVAYTLTNNDYALVEEDEDHNNAATRYIYDGTQWAFQYVVNNSAFTQAQSDAINSGITSSLVTQYSGYSTSKVNVAQGSANAGKMLVVDGNGDLELQTVTIPVVVQDFYVDSTTGAITCTFSSTPTTKTVHTIIGNTTIAGTWSSNVFTPTTASDILSNPNGFVVSVA